MIAFLRKFLRMVPTILLGTVQLPGWAMITLAVVIGVPDWKSRYEFWIGFAQSTSPWFNPIIPLLAHPYFPGVLAAIGFIYLIIVGYSGPSVIRHSIVPVVAWIVVGASVIIIASVAISGYIEFRIRQEADKIVAGISRGASPAENNLSHPQRPLRTQSRILQPDQIRILLQELPNLKQYIDTADLAYAVGDDEALSTIMQFFPLLSRVGINTNVRSILPRGPEDQGFIIAVPPKVEVPIPAVRMQELLQIADINTKIVHGQWPFTGNNQFILFAAPQPLQ